MSLSSNLVVRACPTCNREILASSTRCQFCGTEVAPTAVQVELPSHSPPVRNRGGGAWIEGANFILVVLWTIGAGLGVLMSLALGPVGIVFAVFDVCLVFVGIGIVKQQWLAMIVARFFSGAMALYSVYLLIATPALQEARGSFSPLLPLGMLAVALFMLYVFWSMSD